MQDLSQHMIPRHLWDTALPLPPHTYSSIAQSITPESSLSRLINADGLLTAYMHHHSCMVSHSLDRQDPSLHMIPRHLQDTALPVSPCHYSSIPRCITPESSISCPINADGLLTVYMHHHHCMVAHCSDMQDLSRHTIPRHLQDTEVPLYPRHYSYSSNYYTGLIIPMLYQYRRYQCRIYPSLSRCAIPRRLQDTALPSYPRYDSPIPRFTMPGSSLSIPTVRKTRCYIKSVHI
jgi:hypothetical protein